MDDELQNTIENRKKKEEYDALPVIDYDTLRAAVDKKIPLTQGKYALVDNSDFLLISKWKWYYSSEGYARRNENGKTIRMHRVIAQPQTGFEVDHINGDRLDNRRTNLRVCTRTENTQNQIRHRNNTSGFKGVDWHSQAKKWRARIRINGKRVSLGLFKTDAEAGAEYVRAAEKYHNGYAGRI